MEQYYYARQAIPLIIERINTTAADHLKTLLETKHVYQRVSIDAAREFDAFANNIYGDDRDLFAQTRTASLAGATFGVSDREVFVENKEGNRTPILTLILKGVKLFCGQCGGKEAFRPVWWSDATSELRKPSARDRLIGNMRSDFQLFTLTYQCQRCAGVPHAFLVRRDGWQLFLDGRAPFEEVEVPTFIPKPERGLYRDAIVASHGGKTLAALFYLRTFIEQFARRQVRPTGRITGDDLMIMYGATLPEKQRDHMPSLREWYERLSSVIHTAQEDTELFEQARSAIETHFDFRRLFRVEER